jgi:uncharacterized MAPEG superfamily protein
MFVHRSLTDKQSGVLKGIVIGAVITVVVIAGSIILGPKFLAQGLSASERIAFSLKSDLAITFILAISISRLARHRFFTAKDIDGSGLTQSTETAKVMQATLQNTLEQAVLAVLVHMTWVVTMPADRDATIPAAAVLFLTGRILFIRGYSGGAPSRALGFALTFYPSMLMLVIILAQVVLTITIW